MRQLGPLQLRVMIFMWYSEGENRDIHSVTECLNTDTKQPKLAYTTVATVMRSLVDNQFLTSVKSKVGHRYLFRANAWKDDYIDSQLKHITDTFFDGDEHELCNHIQIGWD